MAKLTLVSIEREGFVRVACEGDVTSADAPADGKNRFEPLLGVNWPTHRVVLDMGKTNYIDSSAIGWLIASQREFKARGGMLVLHSVAPRIRQMLDILKLGQLVPIVDDEAAARALLTGGNR